MPCRIQEAGSGPFRRLVLAKLIYLYLVSLDGYVEDERGGFDWAAPDEEVHAFVNDVTRPVGTYLYGHRMYEVMTGWETDPSLAAESPAMRDFAAIWQAADKIVSPRRWQRSPPRGLGSSEPSIPMRSGS